MTEFKWHLMADEIPEFGKRDYLVMGPKGGLRIARGFRESACGPLGARFFMHHTEYGIIPVDQVHAWAEIPPLETDNANVKPRLEG